jgi:hypothetical protein
MPSYVRSAFLEGERPINVLGIADKKRALKQMELFAL